jgi:hypothetical protein
MWLLLASSDFKTWLYAGKDLETKGFGGLYAVGKAAEKPPALVTLSYDGGDEEVVSLVGKGIVYDTGGLSIKGKEFMPTMKRDMGGAAAVLGAFHVGLAFPFFAHIPFPTSVASCFYVLAHISIIRCLPQRAIYEEREWPNVAPGCFFHFLLHL